MDRPISRRDFLDGVALTALAGYTAGHADGLADGHTGTGRAPRPTAAETADHPPAFQGLRGDTPHAVGTGHALRDGRFWEHAGTPEDTGERYDLVVVGAGISGVTAAYLWWRADPGARILILDGHDDVGGQARRTEFPSGAGPGTVAGYGGSPYLPAALTPEAEALLRDLGVAIRRPADAPPREGVFCDRETFGRAERLVLPGPHPEDWIADLPMAPAAKADLARLVTDPPDWFPGLDDDAKKERLAALTYPAFLRDVCRVHDDVAKFYRTSPCRDRACHADTLTALDAWAHARHTPGAHTYPGFTGLALDPTAPSRYNSPGLKKTWHAGPAIQYFPDGNHTLIRLMLARMLPTALDRPVPDHTPHGHARSDDVRLDYGRLDLPGARVRVRLSSLAVLVREAPPGTAGRDRTAPVTVAYFDDERVRTVRAGAVVMACWHGMIPYLVPGLPPDQRTALAQAVRTPIVYATVRLRHARPWHQAGADRVRFTGAYWAHAELSPTAHRDPDAPVSAHLLHLAARPGLPPAEAAAAGRRDLIATPYAHLEYTVREQLTRLLSPHGFDPARDIEGLTVNRWGHGRPIEPTPLFAPSYPDGPFPSETATRPFGRVAFAGSDATLTPTPDASITAAHHAVTALRALT